MLWDYLKNHIENTIRERVANLQRFTQELAVKNGKQHDDTTESASIVLWEKSSSSELARICTCQGQIIAMFERADWFKIELQSDVAELRKWCTVINPRVS